MAINRDDFLASLNKSAVWDVGVPIKRGNPLPLDSRSVFASYNDAVAYAQGDFSYPGHIIAVVNEDFTAQAYILDGNCNLQELGSGSGAAMLFISTVAALNIEGEAPNGVPADVKVGQQAFVSEDKKIHFLTSIGDGTVANFVWEVQASDAPTWGGATNKVNFTEMNYSTYKALETKVSDTLYFITDKNMIFKGSVDVTTDVVLVSTFDSLESTAIAGKLYVNAETFEIGILNGDSIVKLSPGYLSDGANWAQADSNKLATIGLIKTAITSAIESISTAVSFDKDSGSLSVGDKFKNEPAILTDVAHAPSYDASTLTLTIPVYGGNDVVVNIPKDKFVTKGSYNEETGNIELTIDGQEEVVTIPASALIDVYLADNTDHNVQVTISDDNKISANIKIDATAGNALVYDAEKGFMVDISGKMDSYSNGVESEITLSTADGKSVTRSGKTILDTGDLGTSDNKIPVASVIANAISVAVNAAKTTLESEINGKMDKLSGTEEDSGKIAIISSDGTSITMSDLKVTDLLSSITNKIDKMDDKGFADVVVTATADGGVQRTTKKIGGATFENPSEDIIPTEDEIASQFAWTYIE